MDQAIAGEWGRFLRELKAKDNESVKNRSDGGGAGDGAEPGADGAKNALLQRLEEALARSGPTEKLGDAEAAAPRVERAGGEGPQEPVEGERPYREQFSRNAAGNGAGKSWVKTSAGDPCPAPEAKRAASGETGRLAMRAQWNGESWEEGRVAVTPGGENAPVPERQIALHQDAAEQKAPLTCTQHLGEEMWKTLTGADAAVTEEPATHANGRQAARGHETSRWFVLAGVLGGATAAAKPPEERPAEDIPVLQVFSLAGGVGKTNLVATLGRALAARGERVLLVEATPLASLQYFFGACDSRPGVVRTFRPPASSSDAPIRLVSLEPEALAVETAVQGALASDIQRWAQGSSRVIVDVATGSAAMARGLSRMSPVVLAPLVPDLQAVVTANSMDAFFRRNSAATGGDCEVYYLLNQFDPSLPLHLDVRKALRERLGERMLPFTLPRTPAVSEALAEGMTIVDYAPDSPATEEFTSLAKWIGDVLAPADMNLRGMRWTER